MGGCDRARGGEGTRPPDASVIAELHELELYVAVPAAVVVPALIAYLAYLRRRRRPPPR